VRKAKLTTSQLVSAPLMAPWWENMALRQIMSLMLG
jgi:hypothetical protein